MFKTLINAWNVKDIRTKMLYTLLLVVIYRFGSFIPVPGVDASKIAAAADTYSILSFSTCFPAATSVSLPSLPWVLRLTSPAA